MPRAVVGETPVATAFAAPVLDGTGRAMEDLVEMVRAVAVREVVRLQKVERAVRALE